MRFFFFHLNSISAIIFYAGINCHSERSEESRAKGSFNAVVRNDLDPSATPQDDILKEKSEEIAKTNMSHYVYMIENESADRHYIGYTTDVERRISEHNQGSAKSTRPFGPWKCIYSESFDSKSNALKREWRLKHSKGRKEKQDIITQHGGIA